LKVKQLVAQTVTNFVAENPGNQVGIQLQEHGFIALSGKTKDGWNVTFEAPNTSFSPNWLLRASKGEPKKLVVRNLEYNNENNIRISGYTKGESSWSGGLDPVKWNKEARKYLEAILPEEKVVVT